MTQPSTFLAANWTWSLAWSAEDQCFIAKIAEFPDFFAAGASNSEAVQNAREALASHIEGYIVAGYPLPVPRGSVAISSNGASVEGNELAFC
jgi:predicted RNase H-like HicB family nuclease